MCVFVPFLYLQYSLLDCCLLLCFVHYLKLVYSPILHVWIVWLLASVSHCSGWDSDLALARRTDSRAPQQTTLTPWVCSSVISSLSYTPQHPSACPLLLSTARLSLSPFPAWHAVKTAVKRSLISPAIPRETQMKSYYQPFLSPATPLHYKCWQETAVPSLTFYRAIRTHTHAHHSYYQQCLWISSLEWCGGI